ncbi:hypothetical protein [Priestia megaterium]|uniref:hypothetical protein n=1 Tax=Priestia megaterium TaxID=1404 RepID=UPI002877592C|nr:hypothetical protein [Priestia megaterium]
MTKPIDDNKLDKMINDVFAWSQSIRREANKAENDGIDDSALIIQEILEQFLIDNNIKPDEIIDYDKHGKSTY